MKDITVGEFCRKFGACEEGRKWAYKQHPLKSKAPMSAIYPMLIDAPDKSWLLWTATQDGVFDESTLINFVRWCALQVIHLWGAPDIVRKYLETGDETLKDAAQDAAGDIARAAWDALDAALSAALDAARDAALSAALDVARDAARDAALSAALDVARDAARDAASAAALSAALSAALDASSDASWDASWDVALDARNKKLMEYGNPFLEMQK